MTRLGYTKIIIEEVRAGLPQRDIARSYGVAIAAETIGMDKPDWSRINAEILRRWKLSGLARIKKLAWRDVRAATGKLNEEMK